MWSFSRLYILKNLKWNTRNRGNYVLNLKLLLQVVIRDESARLGQGYHLEHWVKGDFFANQTERFTVSNLNFRAIASETWC